MNDKTITADDQRTDFTELHEGVVLLDEALFDEVCGGSGKTITTKTITTEEDPRAAYHHFW